MSVRRDETYTGFSFPTFGSPSGACPAGPENRGDFAVGCDELYVRFNDDSLHCVELRASQKFGSATTLQEVRWSQHRGPEVQLLLSILPVLELS